MHGVLVVDKPQGLTSHDVVAAARRVLREPRIGHTGTLDPLATGVLPLALGGATRLVRFLSGADKEYDAVVRFGVTTDSYDITGKEIARTDAVPPREAVLEALGTLRGEYLQMPPPFSAKKVAGRRAYALARREETVELTPVPVRVARLDLLEVDGPRARVTLTCSAGFYVRSFAHRLGELTGTGACLEALRRTRSGEFRLEDAVPLEEIRDADRLIPMDRLLPDFPAVVVRDERRGYIPHGRELQEGDYEPYGGSAPAAPAPAWVRILDTGGALVAMATPGRAPGSLHPSVVLI